MVDYNNIPTTVFTPLEYGAIGLSEEDAIEKYGKLNIEVYHQNFWPLEWTVAERESKVMFNGESINFDIYIFPFSLGLLYEVDMLTTGE